MNPQKSRQAGYSLAEMLTVVAIVGVLALVSVPSFMNYYNSNKVKASMRSFTTDLRTARMLAISRGHEVKFSYKTGENERRYNYFEGNRALGTVTVWTPITGPGSNPPKPQKTLEDILYFPEHQKDTPQTFEDEDADGFIDVIFFPDGHARIPNKPETGNGAVGTITLKTKRKVPRPQYAIEISPSGRVVAK